MESVFTKNYTLGPKTLAVMRGVWHAVATFLLAAAFAGPFSMFMWYASEVKIYLSMLLVFVLALFATTHLMKKDLLKEPTSIARIASTTCFVLVGFVMIADSLYVGDYTRVDNAAMSLVLFVSSLAAFPLINYFWMKWYLGRKTSA